MLFRTRAPLMLTRSVRRSLSRAVGRSSQFSKLGVFANTSPRALRLLCTTSAAKNKDFFAKASKGDLNAVRSLLEEGGVDPNTVDESRRSILHYAARSGDASLVQYLLNKGANVNAVDSYGSTPLSEACKVRHAEVATILRAHGGKLSVSPQEAGAALCQAAAIGDIAYLETLLDAPNASVNAVDYDRRSPLHVAASTGQKEAVKFLLSRGADPNLEDRWGNTPWLDAVRCNNGEISKLLEQAGARVSDQPLQNQDASSGDKIRLRAGTGATQEFLDQTYEYLLESKTYKRAVVRAEVDWFFNVLDFHRFYFQRFSPKEVAEHIESYIAAKKLAEISDHPQDLHISHEGRDHALYMCPSDHVSMIEVEKKLEKLLSASQKEGFSVTHLKSKGVAVPSASMPLAVYVLDRSSFVPVPEGTDSTKTNDLSKISTQTFLSKKTPDVIARYQEVVNMAAAHLSPVLKVFPNHHDGTVPVMFGFRRESLGSSLAQITELFRTHHLTCERKMVETFSNDIIVYSFYFAADSTAEQIQEFVEQVGVLFLVPRSNALMNLYLSGEFTAKVYAYCVALKKFAYYFLSQDNDDFRALLAQLKGDSQNTQRVLSLRRLMRHEVVTEEFIAEVVVKYPDIMSRLFDDFDAITNPDTRQAPKLNQELLALIESVASSQEDLQVLKLFMRFNSSIRKTNFHKFPKSSLSYRLDASVVADLDLQVPFGLFMIMSNDFQGFHIRFGDIARGGVRAIKSDTPATYGRNKESLFMENYNLAHTQMRKNKDIPELGSKGTVFLGLGMTSDKNVEIAFRKYVSGLLDVLLPHEQVVDHYGRPEIIFLGPDENTAGLMEWAALYSKRRGYPFWKAFTTGKPPSLGGIPHDTYGMTTRSVHRYVLETLKKFNIKESEVTKLQTGGPDGDLGSNEILLSEDRTIAIVDISGVLYDPNGLNRDALRALARARKPVEHFDVSKLSPQGFLVKKDERGRTLPNGEVVDGRALRDEFHLNHLSTADLFVPCGGRPESVSAKNVHKLFMPDGKTPRFKYIVEGANLFLTQEARLTLEQAGVILFKDASANKGGVTSSSLEVLAALSLTDAEAMEHMSASDEHSAPEFYKAYVKEVQRRIEENAMMEFHCIWDESVRSGTSRVILTDILSDRINAMNASIAASDLFEREELRNRVLGNAVPKILQELVGGLHVVLQRVPENYMRAIFNKHLASRFIYTYGINADHIAFYRFMEDYAKGKF